MNANRKEFLPNFAKLWECDTPRVALDRTKRDTKTGARGAPQSRPTPPKRL